MDVQKALIEGVIQDLVEYLVEENNITIEEAMDKVFRSTLLEKLTDRETGLYRESSAYNYELLKDELKYGAFIQNEI